MAASCWEESLQGLLTICPRHQLCRLCRLCGSDVRCWICSNVRSPTTCNSNQSNQAKSVQVSWYLQHFITCYNTNTAQTSCAGCMRDVWKAPAVFKILASPRKWHEVTWSGQKDQPKHWSHESNMNQIWIKYESNMNQIWSNMNHMSYMYDVWMCLMVLNGLGKVPKQKRGVRSASLVDEDTWCPGNAQWHLVESFDTNDIPETRWLHGSWVHVSSSSGQIVSPLPYLALYPWYLWYPWCLGRISMNCDGFC